jgi:prophage antirepressor-like protein
MNELTVFHFEEGREVRTLMRDGEPWFVAKDVCDVLELTNVTEALRNMPDDEVSNLSIAEVRNLDIPNRGVNIINEPGLYRLIFQSRKPEAEAFKRWVFHEVLPAIRKTGAYSLLKKEYKALLNVYHQNENFRNKYIDLLDELERIKPSWWKSLWCDVEEENT